MMMWSGAVAGERVGREDVLAFMVISSRLSAALLLKISTLSASLCCLSLFMRFNVYIIVFYGESESCSCVLWRTVTGVWGERGRKEAEKLSSP